MALDKYAVRFMGGNTLPLRQFTSGSAIAPMDVVTVAADDGFIDPTAADGESAIGWALGAADGAADTVTVLLAVPGVTVVMPTTGTEAVTNVGELYALAGTTGGQTVDLSDTGHDLFRVHAVDITNELVEVSILASASQAV